MSSAYIYDETATRKILKGNALTTNPKTQLKLIIYYMTRRTSRLVIRNNCLPPSIPLQEVKVAYQYSRNTGNCNRLNIRYIGSTTTTLLKKAHSPCTSKHHHHHRTRTHDNATTRTTLQ